MDIWDPEMSPENAVFRLLSLVLGSAVVREMKVLISLFSWCIIAGRWRSRRVRSPGDRSVGAGRAVLSLRNTSRDGWLVAIGDHVSNSTK
jgi:hypothetical protein